MVSTPTSPPMSERTVVVLVVYILFLFVSFWCFAGYVSCKIMMHVKKCGGNWNGKRTNDQYRFQFSSFTHLLSLFDFVRPSIAFSLANIPKLAMVS